MGIQKSVRGETVTLGIGDGYMVDGEIGGRYLMGAGDGQRERERERFGTHERNVTDLVLGLRKEKKRKESMASHGCCFHGFFSPFFQVSKLFPFPHFY